MKCEVCLGYGWWPYGDLCPIGPMDALEIEEVVVKCPWCKNGKVTKGERYKILLNKKKEMDK